MSDQYTPTTDSVEWDYATRMAPARDDTRRTRFRAWLATVKAEVWDEAVKALDRHYGDLSGLDRIVQDLGDLNPHRKETEND